MLDLIDLPSTAALRPIEVITDLAPLKVCTGMITLEIMLLLTLRSQTIANSCTGNPRTTR